MKIAPALALLLAFSVATLWVPQRWALSALEAGAFLLTILAMWHKPFDIRAAVLAPAFFVAWGLAQLAAHWTAVPAATIDACLYWLAAACLVYLGEQCERERFLKYALVIGTTICFLGIIQLFTSRGNVFWLFPSGFDSRVIGPFVSPNNYAAFVELLIPVALTRRGFWRLPVAAALAATVAASGSRAGAIVAATEIVVVLALQRRARAVLLFVGLAAACVAVVGPQLLWMRFIQESDPFAVRREFLESTVAMFRAQPVHGFGLGTWPSAYPQFALIDTGEIANHAHNEWAQWAAEGGAPALATMLALLVWLGTRVRRHVWALGLLAVLIHSLADYPFLRLGLAAWIFALIGILSKNAGRPIRLPRYVCAALLLFAVWQTARLAYADALYRRLTPDSIEHAARLDPARADIHFTLAQLNPRRAVPQLKTALTANPYFTQARIALAQELESSGDDRAAERSLLEAVRLDHQFAPAWALANFYFRHDAPDAFWNWAHRAATISFGDRRALFDLCFLASDDPQTVFARIGNPQLEEPFLRYLVAMRGASATAGMALRIARRHDASERSVLLDYIDAAIAEGHPDAAWRVWNLLGSPARGRGFDWRIPPADGVYVARNGAKWRIELSGREGESCVLLSRAVASGAFLLHYAYRTEALPKRSGIVWQTPDGEFALDASPDWRAVDWRILGTWVKLAYRRTPGSVRAEGVLYLRDISLTIPQESADKVTGCGN